MFIRLIVSQKIVTALMLLVAISATLLVGTGLGNQEIVFHSNRDGNSNLYRMDLDRELTIQLTYDSVPEISPEWSADGQKIAFTSEEDNQDEVFIMDASGRNRQQVTFGDGRSVSPSWSPNGEELVFVSDRDGDWEVYRVGLNDGLVIQLTDNEANDTQASWSPDGEMIVFASDRDGQNEDVYVMAADGGDVRQLTDDEADDGSMGWSPDGKRIVWVSERSTDIGICDEPGRRVTPPCLIYVDIFTMTTEGTDIQRITKRKAGYWSPSWSPNGEWILYAGNRRFDWSVYMIRHDGSEVVRLTNEPGRNNFPAWRPK